METDRLIEMTQKPYDNEEVLQRRLAEFPLLLAGEQMNPAKPRQWALVSREAAIPDKEGGSERWSADHLFVDQDAIPTIVEVKRSEDTRIRREVLGQLLDYVAHAAIYWEEDLLRERFIETHESAGADPEAVLTELVGEEDVDTFWDHVVSNLRSGKIRLLIVADEIPSELRRVIEFLNEQMKETEVLAVEVAQYVGEEKRAFVPRLIGQTEEAKRTKSRTDRLAGTEDEFLEHVESNVADGTITTEEGDAIRDLYEFIKLEADDYEFGGTANASVTARWTAIGGSNGMFTVQSNGLIPFWQPKRTMVRYSVPWGQKQLAQWHEELSMIDHADASIDWIREKQNLPIAAVVDGENRERFKQACLEFARSCEMAGSG